MEFTNWREREQAANLCQLMTADPTEPLLVWCGNSHASRGMAMAEWMPSWSPPRTLSPKNQKLEWLADTDQAARWALVSG